jgi:hypothetical protein
VAVLIGGIVAFIVVVGVVTAGALRRRSRDDVHSVEHYHRSMHTLEEMQGHPSQPSGNGQSAFPAPAFRVGTPTVRPIEPNETYQPPGPQAAPPPVTNPAEPVMFDDEVRAAGDEQVQPEDSDMRESRAIHAINRPRRRLGAPLAAIGAVAVLIVVLVVTGLHTTTPSHHAKASARDLARPAHRSGASHPTTTTTTAPPVVSLPSAPTNQSATYQVAVASYTLALSANGGECWVRATDASGTLLFTGIISAGQSQTVPAAGSVTVVAGAPSVFAATVNGAPVTLPPGPVAPFTLKFVSAPPPGSG